jgi:hypothetical protein
MAPAALEFGAEFPIVIDLAVLDDDDAAVLVRDRLVAAGEIDDGEAPCCKADSSVMECPLAVRTPVDQSLVHRLEDGRFDLAAVQ